MAAANSMHVVWVNQGYTPVWRKKWGLPYTTLLPVGRQAVSCLPRRSPKACTSAKAGFHPIPLREQHPKILEFIEALEQPGVSQGRTFTVWLDMGCWKCPTTLWQLLLPTEEGGEIIKGKSMCANRQSQFTHRALLSHTTKYTKHVRLQVKFPHRANATLQWI